MYQYIPQFSIQSLYYSCKAATCCIQKLITHLQILSHPILEKEKKMSDYDLFDTETSLL